MCDEPLILSEDGKSCVTKCNSNEFISDPTIDKTSGEVTALKCEKCHDSCLRCIGGNSADLCTACHTEKFLQV
jgi:hypothetical protein